MSDSRLFEWRSQERLPVESEGPPWAEVEAPSGQGPFGGGCDLGESDFFSVQSPPQQAVERIEGTCPGLEWSTRYAFVLSENGEVWMWMVRAYPSYLSACGGIILAIGCAVGLVLFVIAFVKDRGWLRP